MKNTPRKVENVEELVSENENVCPRGFQKVSAPEARQDTFETKTQLLTILRSCDLRFRSVYYYRN
jgi:hypothetical protein